MKWFKHFSDASHDEFIVELEENFGLEGYARYFKILETIAIQMKTSRGNAVSYPWSKWQEILKGKRKKLEIFLEYLHNKRGIYMESKGNILKIECLNLLKIKDNYLSDLEATTKKLPSKEEDTDTEIDLDIKKEKDSSLSQQFLKFAKYSHKKIRKTTLPETRVDQKKIMTMLKKTQFPVLRIAWILFLKSSDTYLMGKPRSIPIFCGQIANIQEEAERIYSQSQQKYLAKRFTVYMAPISQTGARSWQFCREKIEEEILSVNYLNLIEPLVFGGVEEGRGILYCPDQWHRKKILENYFDLLEKTMTTVFGEPVKLELLLPEGAIKQNRASKTLKLVSTG